MYEQELHHLDTMSKLLVQHRARPSLLGPLWHVGGFALGAATALLGKEAAMACTVAVETEISQHYNSQLRDILARADTADMKELQEILQKFRDDEIDHMHSATEHGAAGAPAYNMLVEGWFFFLFAEKEHSNSQFLYFFFFFSFSYSSSHENSS